jgi:hypothetical protein
MSFRPRRNFFSAWLRISYQRSSAVTVRRSPGRVAAIYKGFEREARHAPAYQSRSQSRQTATGGNIYSRQDIARLYEARRKGEINGVRLSLIFSLLAGPEE